MRKRWPEGHGSYLGSSRGRLSAPLSSAYALVTGRQPTARVKAALDQFSLYATGTIIARALSIVAQLYVARNLGPQQFGRFALGLTIALMLTTPIQEGWGAAFVRFSVTRPVQSTPWHLLRAAWLLAAASALTVVVLALVAMPALTTWLAIPADVYFAGVATSVTVTLWLTAKASCQGLQDWTRLVMIELSWALTILVVPFLIRRVFGGFDWKILAAFSAAYVVSALPVLPYWLHAPEGRVIEHLRHLWQFGKYLGGAGVIAALLFYGDRIIVNHGAGLRVVGVYQVYALTTMGVAAFVSQLVNRFMFPLLNLGDRAAFSRLFRQALPWATATYLPTVFGLGAVVIWTLRYPFHPFILAVATLSGLAYCVMTFLNFLVATEEHQGPRTVLHVNLLACVIFFPLTVVLVPQSPLAAPFGAYVVAFTAGALLAYRRLMAQVKRPR